jgi:hypothetical protein
MADKLTIIRDLKIYLQNGFDPSVKEIILFGSQVNGKSYEMGPDPNNEKKMK